MKPGERGNDGMKLLKEITDLVVKHYKNIN